MLTFPENLKLLHYNEEKLHHKSIGIITSNHRLLLHLNMIERAMDIANVFRQYPTKDEDLRVIQMCALRLFNALASSYKLMMSGYYQKSAMIMRDIIEVVFLLELFKTDRPAIKKWRFADKSSRLKEFGPVKVRKALDKRDNFTEKKRSEMYDMFSELASHVNMNATLMLKPKGRDIIQIGPFLDPSSLEATLGEMGRLAAQVGGVLDLFLPDDWAESDPARQAVQNIRKQWFSKFYPKIRAKK